ncbi:MAG TPA: class I SAM-dependent methyltransferase, partial [Bacteroidia bacterium]|nr:class I SAM-dependent methyltransferase [Bacteroidia bacterium]
MFDNISSRYDFLNHLLSLGIDKGWRKKAINMLKANPPKKLLDIATGTGDFAIAALTLNPEKITGIDISEGMLEMGRKKLKAQNLSGKIELLYGDSENISFPDNTFDAAIVAFGVRNFEDLDKG